MCDLRISHKKDASDSFFSSLDCPCEIAKYHACYRNDSLRFGYEGADRQGRLYRLCCV
jgi:hypothetical protein